MRVCVIGDSIIDEYCHVDVLGKGSKEFCLATRVSGKEVFRGGVWACGEHLKTFCEVDVVTGLETTYKRRYVGDYVRKLFEVQRVDRVSERVLPDFGSYDMVVVADFGHGALDGVDLSGARYLAVNAQTNASNFGFNLVTKFEKADFACVDEPEARLAAGDRTNPIEHVMRVLAKDRFKRFVVTHGSHGAYGLDETGFYHEPAFTDRVVDTMGAGDAFFAITSFFSKDTPMPALLRIGNAAGALKTQIVGHRKAVTKEALDEYLRLQR